MASGRRLAGGGPGGLTKGFREQPLGGRVPAGAVRCGGGLRQRDYRGEDSSMALRERGDGPGRLEGGGRRGGRWPVRMTCVGAYVYTMRHVTAMPRKQI